MAKKGEFARESVKNIIIDAFTAKGGFVAFRDKKIYVKIPDGPNGEVLQFAITMTMPKTPIDDAASTAAPTDWRSNSVSTEEKVQVTPTELSPEDAAKVKELMKKLGVS